jgi:heme A synthase
VLGLAVWAFACFPRGHQVRRGAVYSVIFIATESLIGAGLVLLRLVGDNASVARAIYLSVHLTNTFILIATLALTAWWSAVGTPVRVRPADFLRGKAGIALAAALAVGVSGAVAALGATLFPESAVSATADAMTPDAQLLFSLKHFKLHPLAALIAGLYLMYFALVSLRQSGPPVRGLAVSAVALVAAQWTVGFANAALLAPIWLQMIHLLLADLLWASLVLLAAANAQGRANFR